MVAELVGLQVDWLDRVDELLALGLPDWRPAAYLPDVHALMDRALVDVPSARRLEQLVLSLPERLAAVDACGVPDTLLHGDFHPGNVRGHGADLRVLDWGDSGVGHPLLDQTAFCARLGPDDRAQVLATWDRLWGDALPGCDPARAAALLAPVAALRAAVVYQRFLDDIEPAERVYHERDPVTWLLRAAELA
jgi:aminoglycoside phosphotransferase (APT) family kinase protein